MNRQGVWIELIFEKRRPELRAEGKVIGIDRGFRKAFVTSDGQEIGAELRDQIRRKGERSKTSYYLSLPKTTSSLVLRYLTC